MLRALPGTRPLEVVLPIKVQTYDIDFAGHVNNQVYVRWLEDLRMEVLRQHCPLPRLLDAGLAPILHSTHIVYHRSIDLRDEPVGRMWCSELGRATLTLHAEICVGEAVCAAAVQRGILLRMGTTRPGRVPEELRARFEAAIGA